MPSLTAVFEALPPPAIAEDALLHGFLHADNLAQFRVYRLLAVVLAILPRLTTLFLVLGRLLPPLRIQQRMIDVEFGEEGPAENRVNFLSLRQEAYESLAIRVLTIENVPIPTSIGYPLLPELQVLILDHISNIPPLFEALNGDNIVDDLQRLCPQLRCIQTKGPLHLRRVSKPILPSTSMEHLLVRQTISPASELSFIRKMYPNLVSLRIVLFNGTEFDTPNQLASFGALTKLPHLQHLSLTTPHHLT